VLIFIQTWDGTRYAFLFFFLNISKYRFHFGSFGFFNNYFLLVC
jgi:hypothetical protein